MMKCILIQQGERQTFMKFSEEDEEKVKSFYEGRIICEGKDLQDCVQQYQRILEERDKQKL